MNASKDKPIVLIGGGGHARVCLDLLSRQNRRVVGYVALESSLLIQTIPYLGEDDALDEFSPNQVILVLGIGFTVGSSIRETLFNRYKSRGYSFASLIHDSAIVSANATMREGAQVMAGAIVQTGAVIGENTLINTRASVDHDSCIGNHSAIMPGTAICGNVKIAQGVFVGAGSTILPELIIGERTVVGAGAVVISNLSANSFVYGVPAKEKST